MSKKLALLFAGQGAQVVGMGKDLAQAEPCAAEIFRKADELLGLPLSQTMFEGPTEELTKTSVAQPALFVHGMACLAVIREKFPSFTFHAAAGLSLGEFTAHAAAGTFSFEDGLRLVAARARFMQKACEETEGAMAAMIGGEEGNVRTLAADTDVDVANINAPGQIVLSGESSKIALAVSLAKEHGIRKAVELTVAGAFHSRLMQSAYESLQAVLDVTPMNAPSVPVVCNVDAEAVQDLGHIKRTLADQVTGSVLWRNSCEYLIDLLHCERFLEIGPGGVLAGLMGRIRKGVPVATFANSADLPALAAFLET